MPVIRPRSDVPILLDRQPFTIVGVMPRGFTFPQRGPILNNVPADVYVPIGFTASERRAFGSMYNNSVIARLKAGVTPAQADADTRALVRSNAREMYPVNLSGLAEVLGGSAVLLTAEVSGRLAHGPLGGVCGRRIRPPDRLRRHRQPDAGARHRA